MFIVPLPVLDPVRVQVSFEVVNAKKWEVPREGKRLREIEAHQEGAGQAWAVRYRDRFDPQRLRPITHHVLQQGRKRRQVLPRCDLWDHSAEPVMEVGLARECVCDDPASVLDDGDSALIT